MKLLIISILLNISTVQANENKFEYYQQCSINQVLDLLPQNLHERVKNVTNVVLLVSKELSVNPCLVLSVIWTESTFKQNRISSVGALGLMQVKPSTRQYVLNKLDAITYNRLITLNLSSGLEYKELRNVIVGTYYLRYLYEKFNDYDKAMIAYNIGPRNVRNNKQVEAGKRYLDKINLKFNIITKN